VNIKRGFNFRNFDHGKPFAPLPELFDKEEKFLEEFSRVRNTSCIAAHLIADINIKY